MLRFWKNNWNGVWYQGIGSIKWLSLNFAKLSTLSVNVKSLRGNFFNNTWLQSSLKYLNSSKRPIHDTFASLLCSFYVLRFLKVLKMVYQSHTCLRCMCHSVVCQTHFYVICGVSLNKHTAKRNLQSRLCTTVTLGKWQGDRYAEGDPTLTLQKTGLTVVVNRNTWFYYCQIF